MDGLEDDHSQEFSQMMDSPSKDCFLLYQYFSFLLCLSWKIQKIFCFVLLAVSHERTNLRLLVASMMSFFLLWSCFIFILRKIIFIPLKKSSKKKIPTRMDKKSWPSPSIKNRTYYGPSCFTKLSPRSGMRTRIAEIFVGSVRAITRIVTRDTWQLADASLLTKGAPNRT